MITGFYGQTGIVTQLNKVYIPLMKQGRTFNFLFKAPSGMGKTTLAKLTVMATGTGEKTAGYVLPNEDGQIPYDKFDKYQYILIDEAHTLKGQEMLYPLLDRGDKTFLICSNEFGLLKEPLQNRCINFIYLDYTYEEMQYILIDYANSLGYWMDDDFIDEVIKGSAYNPRVGKAMISSLHNYELAGNPAITSLDELKGILKSIFGIEDGLNSLQRRYLEFLRTAESASLNLISSVLKVDVITVRRDIEPALVQRGLIGIGARGRYIKDN